VQYTNALRVHGLSVGSCDFPDEEKLRGSKREPGQQLLNNNNNKNQEEEKTNRGYEHNK